MALKKSDKRNITIRGLLYHESGLDPTLDMYKLCMDTATYEAPLFKSKKDDIYNIGVDRYLYGNKNAKLRSDIYNKEYNIKTKNKICDGVYAGKAAYDTIMNKIYDSKLRANKSFKYSCLNFCLLMDAEQQSTSIPHDEYVEDVVFSMIGANRTTYHPLLNFKKEEIAPTEEDKMLRRQQLHGYVHDELACFSGGVQGNAGLFSNATDIAKFCQLLLNGGVYGDSRIYSKGVTDKFVKSKSEKSRRGLGFDKPDLDNLEKSPTCESASSEVFGHLGFTGTCFWVDPKNDMIYIFLSNRVKPSRNNNAFRSLRIRPAIFQAFYDNIITK